MNICKNSRVWSGLAVLGLSLFLVGPAMAGVVYQDDFNRDGGLLGTSPTVNALNSTYISYGGSSGFYTTTSGGGYAFNGNSGGSSNALAYLPLTLRQGVYEFSLTLRPNAGTTTDWLGMGFTGLATNPLGDGWLPQGDAQLWLLYRDNADTSSFFDGPLLNELNNSGGTPGAAVRFKITLDSVSGAFAISDDANLINRTGNLSATSLASIRYIGFSVYRAASGDVSNLSLSFTPSVPESGTLVLGLMAGVPGLALLRRNRRIVRGRRSPRLVSAETVIGPGNCC